MKNINFEKFKIFKMSIMFFCLSTVAFAGTFDKLLEASNFKNINVYVEKEELLSEILDNYINENLDIPGIIYQNNNNQENFKTIFSNIYSSDIFDGIDQTNSISMKILIDKDTTENALTVVKNGSTGLLEIRNTSDNSLYVFDKDSPSVYRIKYKIIGTFNKTLREKNSKIGKQVQFFQTSKKRIKCGIVDFDVNGISTTTCMASPFTQNIFKTYLTILNKPTNLLSLLPPTKTDGSFDSGKTWFFPNQGKIDILTYNPTKLKWEKNDYQDFEKGSKQIFVPLGVDKNNFSKLSEFETGTILMKH